MNAPLPASVTETLCDRQPVHVPGNIQPHGLLLVLAAGAGPEAPLLAMSANALPGGAETGPLRLGDVLEAAAVRIVTAALDGAAAVGGPAVAPELLEGLRTRDGRCWTGLLRRGTGAILLELEPEAATDREGMRGILRDLNQAIAELRLQDDAAAACGVACTRLRLITGFDRIMAYRFMPDWSGAVVAEALAPDPSPGQAIDSYLGLVFPASDIPAPARALYGRNRLRLIEDARAAPSPLLGFESGLDAGAIDLGDAVLRGVAPVHLQYLANMGVHASMSVAIAGSGQGDPDQPARLWGLLACHHQDGPLFVDHVRRQAAETIAQTLSWRLAELAAAAEERQMALMRRAQAPFLEAGDDEAGGGAALPAWTEADAAPLLEAAGASGLAVVGVGTAAEGLELRLGRVPEAPVLAALVDWLDRVSAGRTLCSDRVCQIMPAGIAALLDPAEHSGLLATPLGELAGDEGGGWALWFRPELRRQVRWAGFKPDSPDPARALTPRASFAAWREEVANCSAPWSEASRAAGRVFRNGLVTVLARRSARVARSNALLRHHNQEIRFFADAATHDLKEPLWQVQVLSGLIRDGLAELLATPAGAGGASVDPAQALRDMAADLELETMSGLIVTSAGRMRGMIDDLARFAIAGRDPDRMVETSVRALADDAMEDLGEAWRAVPDATISLDGLGAFGMPCDASQMRRVFQNLFSNALKYRCVTRPLAVVATAAAHPRGVRVTVVDNGVGFEAADAERLFEPFRRFDRPGAAATDGLGLGLAICRRIIEAHCGSIVATPLSPGARFDIVLPTQQDGCQPEQDAGRERW